MIMRKGIKILAVLVFISAATILLLKISKDVDVKTATIQRQPFLITVTATSTGTIKAETEARISSQRTGRIIKLLFDEGTFVDSKKVIAELNSEEEYLNLRLAEATLQKAKAILSETDKRLKRAKELIKSGYISEAELDLTEKEHAVADASVKEAENSLAIAKLNYSYSFIRSPIDGVVTARFVELGDTVTKGNIMGTVVSTDSLYLEGFIDEADISKVSIGKEVNITMDAYQDRVLKGVVYRVSPVVTGGKQETRTFEVRVRLKEMPPAIKPGMSAEVEVIVDKADNILIVPSQAMMERDGKIFVYVVKDSKAKLVPVKTGRSNWTYTEVLSGVKEGDEVIINPDTPKLRDGVKIKKK
jgi:RND family efflux transporter MFP subunit